MVGAHTQLQQQGRCRRERWGSVLEVMVAVASKKLERFENNWFTYRTETEPREIH